MKKIPLILTLLTIGLYSCANLFNGVVLPNQCKKCEVINTLTKEVLFTNEGCGSENTKLEDEAKIEAYEKSRYRNLCELEVNCITWKQEPENKE
jgi:hypothetical protein